MADMQNLPNIPNIPNIQKARELAERALSAAKLAKSNVFADKVYRDEPIIMTAAQLENYTPIRYLEMRRMAQGGFQYEPEAKIFYKQGKFMEDFEDDFDCREPFVKYFPTYRAMNLSQLRGYFSWRTKVRRGVIEKTQLSFAFVYIYELLNQIGVKSPEEGYHKLKDFRAAYGEIDPKINGYVNMWLRDYVVYHNLDKSLLDGLPGADSDAAVHALLNYKNHSADDVFSALKSLSSYNIEGSKFFRQYPDDVKNVVYDVYSALSDYYENRRKTGICERFLGKIYAAHYDMFQSAVFYQDEARRDFSRARVYEISDTCRYRYENGAWLCERFFRYRNKNQWLGNLLKNIDLYMRLKYGFKTAIKAEKTAKIVHEVIAEAVGAHLENKRKAALPKVEIDVSKLSDIRDAALQTQNKLTVGEIFDDEEEDQEISFENPVQSNENPAGGDEVERQFLICLLRGEAYDGLIKAHGLMLSTLVDSINERFFEMFGDTVIIDRDGEPILAEDYMDALKGIIDE